MLTTFICTFSSNDSIFDFVDVPRYIVICNLEVFASAFWAFFFSHTFSFLRLFWWSCEKINAATNTVVFKFDWFSFMVNVPNVTSPPFIVKVASLTVTAIVDVIKEFPDSLRETFFQRREIDGGRAHFVRILFVRFFHFIVLLVTIWKSNGRNTVRPFSFPSEKINC